MNAEEKPPINVQQPPDWFRGITRYGSLERKLEAYAFCFEGLRKMGVSHLTTPAEAMKCEDYLKRVGFLPKEATLDAFCTLVTQDLFVLRFSCWSFPVIHGANVISCVYISPSEIRKRDTQAE